MVKTKRERIEVIMREKLAKYEQIRQDIIHKIESMEYRPNQVIPSENELCASYGVSRITVRKAIDELVHEGLLYRIKGKGSFVADNGHVKEAGRQEVLQRQVDLAKEACALGVTKEQLWEQIVRIYEENETEREA